MHIFIYVRCVLLWQHRIIFISIKDTYNIHIIYTAARQLPNRRDDPRVVTDIGPPTRIKNTIKWLYDWLLHMLPKTARPSSVRSL